MAEKSLSALEQVLVDTIQKASVVTGEAIDGAKIVTGKAVDFAQEQIPDVIHQLLMWKMVSAIMWVVIALVCFIVIIKMIRKFWEQSEGAIIIVGLPFSVVCVGVFIVNIMTAVKIWVAPKVYLLEYVADLIK